LLEGEGHGAARRGAQVIMIGHMLQFLESQLKGGTPTPTNE
jgi:dipeptidyl aminopeptidase/acylaminoacyl peptidase